MREVKSKVLLISKLLDELYIDLMGVYDNDPSNDEIVFWDNGVMHTITISPHEDLIVVQTDDLVFTKSKLDTIEKA